MHNPPRHLQYLWRGLLLFAASFLLAQAAAGAVITGLGSAHLMDWIRGITEAIPSVRDMAVLRLSQAVSLVLGFGVPAWIAIRQAPEEGLSVGKPDFSAASFVWIFPVMIAGSFLAAALYIHPDQLPFSHPWIDEAAAREREVESMLRGMMGDLSYPARIQNFIVIAVIPAVVEELFFRGFLLAALSRIMKVHAAVWISAAVFSFFHFQFLGFFSRLALGAVLGYLYVYSGNFWNAVIGHFLNNLLQLLLVWALLASPPEGIDPFANVPLPLWVLPLTLAATTGLLYLYRRRFQPS